MKTPSEQELRVLMILSTRPMHGYGIVKETESDRCPGGKIGLGSLYRIIQRLLEQGFIEETADGEVSAGGRRRNYQTTDRGKRVASQELARIRRLLNSRVARTLADV